MEVRAEVLEKSIRKTTLTSNVISIVIAIIAAFGVGFGFYFNTNSQLESHDNSIKVLEEEVQETQVILNEIQVFRGVSSTEMKNLEKKVDKIDEKIDKLILLQQK